MNKDNEKKTAPEVPAQEQQFTIDVSFDTELLDKKLDRIKYLSKELEKEIKSLPKTIKINYPSH